MQQIEIDMAGAESLQAGFAGLDGAVAAGVGRQHLGDDEDLVAPALDGRAGDLLGTAIGVHLRGVDQRHAAIDAGLNCPDFVGGMGAVLAHVAKCRGRAPARNGHRGKLTVWIGSLMAPLLFVSLSIISSNAAMTTICWSCGKARLSPY